MQPGGNTYFCAPIGTKILKIQDTTQDAYVTWYFGGYNGAFELSNGFYSGYAFYGVRKL